MQLVLGAGRSLMDRRRLTNVQTMSVTPCPIVFLTNDCANSRCTIGRVRYVIDLTFDGL